MKPTLEELLAQRASLEPMVTKLAKLVDSEEFNKVNPANQSELLFQKSHMLNVLIGLNRRIEKAQKAKPPGTRVATR